MARPYDCALILLVSGRGTRPGQFSYSKKPARWKSIMTKKTRQYCKLFLGLTFFLSWFNNPTRPSQVSLSPVEPPDPFYVALGKRIQAARKRASVTQEKLGYTLNLTRTSITNIEKGRQRILVHVLVEIARVLDQPLEELVPRPGEVPAGLDDALKQHPKKTQNFIKRGMSSTSDEK